MEVQHVEFQTKVKLGGLEILPLEINLGIT